MTEPGIGEQYVSFYVPLCFHIKVCQDGKVNYQAVLTFTYRAKFGRIL